jgi:hypothetical protein
MHGRTWDGMRRDETGWDGMRGDEMRRGRGRCAHAWEYRIGSAETSGGDRLGLEHAARPAAAEGSPTFSCCTSVAHGLTGGVCKSLYGVAVAYRSRRGEGQQCTPCRVAEACCSRKGRPSRGVGSWCGRQGGWRGSARRSPGEEGWERCERTGEECVRGVVRFEVGV